MADERDVQGVYSTAEVVAKLRRLADALESGSAFRIQVLDERIHVPVRARFSIEHERDGDQEEVEFQLTWSLADDETGGEADDEPVV